MFVCLQGPRSRRLRRGVRGPGGGDTGGAESPAGGGEGESPPGGRSASSRNVATSIWTWYFWVVLILMSCPSSLMFWIVVLSFQQTLPEVCSEQDELDFLMEALIIR